MYYSQLIDSIVYSENQASVTVDDSWLQGRSLFGGLQAALCVKAMRMLVGDQIPLRTLQFTFMAPIPAGLTTAKAAILRSGKNTRHVEARIIGADNEVLAMAIGVFGESRESQLARTMEPKPVKSPQEKRFNFIPGVTPNFTQHFDAVWLQGGLPFSQHSEPEIIVDVSMKDKVPCSEAHFLAIADFIPPVALSMLAQPVPGSSLTWMLEFLDHDYLEQPLQHWRVEAEMVAASEGYTSQTVTLYAPNQKAIALSRQSMVVFG